MNRIDSNYFPVAPKPNTIEGILVNSYGRNLVPDFLQALGIRRELACNPFIIETFENADMEMLLNRDKSLMEMLVGQLLSTKDSITQALALMRAGALQVDETGNFEVIYPTSYFGHLNIVSYRRAYSLLPDNGAKIVETIERSDKNSQTTYLCDEQGLWTESLKYSRKPNTFQQNQTRRLENPFIVKVTTDNLSPVYRGTVLKSIFSKYT